MKLFSRKNAHISMLKPMRCLLKFASCIIVSSIVVASLPISSWADSGQRWNLGSATNTGKDNGFSGDNTIDRDDPHYGWTLGQFYVSGYTQRTTDTDGDVFLKNIGDQVELHFELLQDIDCLNDDENLSIYADANGYDQYFGTQQFNDCRGLLIIRKTDYQNASSDPVIYTDYLDGVSQGADTVVELCEEGDYEVALDYEIREEHYGTSWNTYVSVPTYTNYRIYFTFKIRNGNCMVFPFDVTTGSELQNESFTDNGFYLDLANSRYLEINVQRAVYTEGANGYTEDIRFNRPASDGTEYIDEGVYTITVHNIYTNQDTVKVIYVGTDPVMRAYVVSGLTLEEIQDLLEAGYQISEEGTLIAPVSEEADEYVLNDDSTVIDNGNDIDDASSETVADSADVKELSTEASAKKTSVVPIVVVIVLLAGAVALAYFKKDFLLGILHAKTSNSTTVESGKINDTVNDIAMTENSEQVDSIEEVSEPSPVDESAKEIESVEDSIDGNQDSSENDDVDGEE